MKWKYWSPECSDWYTDFGLSDPCIWYGNLYQNVTLFMSLTAIQWSFVCDNLNPLRESLASPWEQDQVILVIWTTHQTILLSKRNKIQSVTGLLCYPIIIQWAFSVTLMLCWCETMTSRIRVFISGREQRQKVILLWNSTFLMCIIESTWSCPVTSIVYCCACNMTAGDPVM